MNRQRCQKFLFIFVTFSELNPLSNFHPAPFHHEGDEYINSEQLIQAKKAEFCGDHDKLKQIMCAKTARECKELG